MAERTIYSNPAIATLMNQWFIGIRPRRTSAINPKQTFSF